MLASLVVEPGLWACEGSLVMVLGLSCSKASGPGMEPMYPALQGRFLTAGPQRSLGCF